MVETSSSSRSLGLSKQPSITVDDFEFFKSVGSGSFGQVFLAQDKETMEFVAIKQLNKIDLIKYEKT